MKLFATLKEFIITGEKEVPVHVADALYTSHIIPMNNVRLELNEPIAASLKSGYRPKHYELSRKRSGTSEHTFSKRWLKGTGAVDWTCKDFEKNRDRFLNLIIKHTEYVRICVYDNFIHCDYKDTFDNRRQLFRYDGEKWQFIKNI